MPSELRHLFRPPEVVQAVKEFHRRLGQSLPVGTVVFCGPETDDDEGTAGVRFRIVLAPDPAEIGPRQHPTEEKREELVIEGPTLAAALILHRRDRRIPLPANADKSLRRFGNQVCLVATINLKQEEMPSGLRC